MMFPSKSISKRLDAVTSSYLNPNLLIKIVANHEEVSKKEAYDMIEMYMLTEGGMLELGEICRKWGVEEKKIEELGINVLGTGGGYTAGEDG